MANATLNTATFDLVGNPARTEQLRAAHADAVALGVACELPTVAWRTVRQAAMQYPVFAIKPAMEDLTLRAGLAQTLVEYERWQGEGYLSPALESLMDALWAMKPCRERQIQIALEVSRALSTTAEANRLTAYYLAVAARLYMP